MDTRTLEQFVTVYESGSIAKAAEGLFISPQGLSKSIARLEAELGQTLFERTTHGVAPTHAADILYGRSRELIGLLTGIKQSMNQIADKTLHAAVSSGYVMRLGQGMRDEFSRENPGVALRMEEFIDSAVLDEVEAGKVDCGFTPATTKGRALDVKPVISHPFMLLVRTDDPLSRKSVLSYDDLLGRRLLALGNGHAPYDIIKPHLIAADIDTSLLSPIIEITTGIDLAQRREACCFITDFAASSFAHEGLVALPFDDRTLTWDLGFVTRRDTQVSAEADSLYTIVKKWTVEHGDLLFE